MELGKVSHDTQVTDLDETHMEEVCWDCPLLLLLWNNPLKKHFKNVLSILSSFVETNQKSLFLRQATTTAKSFTLNLKEEEVKDKSWG